MGHQGPHFADHRLFCDPAELAFGRVFLFLAQFSEHHLGTVVGFIAQTRPQNETCLIDNRGCSPTDNGFRCSRSCTARQSCQSDRRLFKASVASLLPVVPSQCRPSDQCPLNFDEPTLNRNKQYTTRRIISARAGSAAMGQFDRTRRALKPNGRRSRHKGRGLHQRKGARSRSERPASQYWTSL